MNHEISRRTALGLGAAAGVSVLLGSRAVAAEEKRRVIVWSEGTEPAKVYPDGIRGAIAASLKPLDGWEIITRTITDDAQGVPEEDLAKTDVLVWWGHKRHNDIKDETVDRIENHVKENGMGFIAVHSSHFARPYKRLMNTPCSWSHYVDDGSFTQILVMTPKHPIAKGVEDFQIPHNERYGDPFRCPKPETVIFGGIYTLPDGSREFSQQGLVWTVGKGRVFYFQPGHETYPILFQKECQQIMRNAVQWCAPERAAV
ncbi:MAG TPA: ThuA domain-containing protein [Tepidisphaeraceae bacterium]|jgi:trehalose utilization protein|nr:ThuA domain-containing protein [Tepidisphaeraceae bacterium]